MPEESYNEVAYTLANLAGELLRTHSFQDPLPVDLLVSDIQG